MRLVYLLRRVRYRWRRMWAPAWVRGYNDPWVARTFTITPFLDDGTHWPPVVADRAEFIGLTTTVRGTVSVRTSGRVVAMRIDKTDTSEHVWKPLDVPALLTNGDTLTLSYSMTPLFGQVVA